MMNVLEGKRLAFVLSEYPSSGSAGYHTYNRELTLTLLRCGATVTWIVLSGRYKKIRDQTHDLYGFDGRFRVAHAPGSVKFGLARVVVSPESLLRIAKSRILSGARDIGRAGPKRVDIGRFCSDDDVRLVSRKLHKSPVDVVLIDTLFNAPVARIAPGRAIVIAHDAFSERVKALRAAGLNPQPAVTARQETELLSSVAGVAAISDADARFFKDILGLRNVAVAAPPIALNFQAVRRSDGVRQLFYMGSAAHHNVDALAHFFADEWPNIRSVYPTLRLIVAGDVCRAFTQVPDGVVFLGRIDSPAQFASSCFAGIDPVRAGSGVKIKILDYLSLGLHCVTTEAGAQGLDALSSVLSVVGEKRSYVDVLGKLIDETDEEVEVYRRNLREKIQLYNASTVGGLIESILHITNHDS